VPNHSNFGVSIEGANLPDRRLAPPGADVFAPPLAGGIGLIPGRRQTLSDISELTRRVESLAPSPTDRWRHYTQRLASAIACSRRQRRWHAACSCSSVRGRLHTNSRS